MYTKMTHRQFLEWYRNPTDAIKETAYQADEASQLLMALAAECRALLTAEPATAKALSDYTVHQIDELICQLLASADETTANEFITAILSNEKIFDIVISRLSDYVNDSADIADQPVSNVEEMLQLIPTLKDSRNQTPTAKSPGFKSNIGKWLLGIAAALFFVFLGVQVFEVYKEYVIGTPSLEMASYDFDKYSPIPIQRLKSSSGVRGHVATTEQNIAAVGALLLQGRAKIEQGAFEDALELLTGYRHFAEKMENDVLRQSPDERAGQPSGEDAEAFLQEYYFMLGFTLLQVSLNEKTDGKALLRPALDAFDKAIQLRQHAGLQTGFREEYYAEIAANQLGNRQKAAMYRKALPADGLFFQIAQ
jgi:hypothetical protein